MKQHYCDIVDEQNINFIVPKIERELPKLTQSSHVPLRTAVLQLPSKSYENRTVCSAFVHFSRNGGN